MELIETILALPQREAHIESFIWNMPDVNILSRPLSWYERPEMTWDIIRFLPGTIYYEPQLQKREEMKLYIARHGSGLNSFQALLALTYSSKLELIVKARDQERSKDPKGHYQRHMLRIAHAVEAPTYMSLSS